MKIPMYRCRRLLHVDDDPQVTRTVAARLARFRYHVVAQNDPRRAIGEIARGQYRVVLLDLQMKHVDGLELLKRIKAYEGGIQVILLSDLVPMTSVLQSLRSGAEACLFKPLDEIEPLVQAVDDAFRKLDRWWQAMDNVSRRGQSEAELIAT